MKTAISMEDELMVQADEAARELRLSRSGLIAVALRGFLFERRKSRLAEQLDAAYPTVPVAPEGHLVKKFRTKLPVQDRW